MYDDDTSNNNNNINNNNDKYNIIFIRYLINHREDTFFISAVS